MAIQDKETYIAAYSAWLQTWQPRVGDRVRIARESDIVEYPCSGWTDEMRELIGTMGVITDVPKHDEDEALEGVMVKSDSQPCWGLEYCYPFYCLHMVRKAEVRDES